MPAAGETPVGNRLAMPDLLLVTTWQYNVFNPKAPKELPMRNNAYHEFAEYLFSGQLNYHNFKGNKCPKSVGSI